MITHLKALLVDDFASQQTYPYTWHFVRFGSHMMYIDEFCDSILIWLDTKHSKNLSWLKDFSQTFYDPGLNAETE